MMKKFLSLVVAALLTVSAVATSASAAKFTDVDANNEALNDAVELLVALGVTKGTSDTTFGTDENVTREQMAAFVYRMMKAGKSVEGGTNVTPFVDLDDPTFYFMISWASSQGIIKGTSATTFNPKGGITLQDAYTMIVRALGYDNGALAYPVGHINKAEDLGLDEDLPSSLNYTDTLTRGDLAIILANMFYAETSETEIKYETTVDRWVEKDLDDDGIADEAYPITTQKPVEYHKTVAEAIFDVVEVSQRVVATPGHKLALEGVQRPDEDVEMLVLKEGMSADAADYTYVGDLGTVEFADLGLEGKADDYFLSDILMFVKVEKNGDRTIYGATAQGVKKTVSFDDIEFGTVSGTSADKYYDGENKEIKKFNGLLTIDGVKTYLYDAPYSYAKDPYGNNDKYAPDFITLDAWDGDIEEEKIFVDYAYDSADFGTEEPVAADVAYIGTWTSSVVDDETVWTNDGAGYLSQAYLGGLGEVDCIDSDGNGKYDYLFVKNYTVGTIDTEEEASLEGSYESEIAAEDPAEALIFTDYSVVEGVEFADEDVVLAYVNVAANYVKVAEVLKGVESEVSTTSSKYYELATGEKIFFENADKVVTNAVGVATADVGDEGTFYFAANDKLVYVTGLSEGLNLNENWVIVLEDSAFESANMVDGKLEKAYYIDIYNDGAIKSVKAKNIVEGTKYADEDTPVTTATAGEVVTNYVYTDYVNKLATGKADKNGAYYFDLLLEREDEEGTSLENKEALEDKEDESIEYRSLNNSEEIEFYQQSDYRYNLDGEIVNIKPYTQIIIRSLDVDGEEIVTAYGYDNLPNIKENEKFSDVSYVLVNNTSSTRYENLAVFYGVLDKEMEGAKGELDELRILTGYSKTTTDDETVVTYNVLNPFTGEVASGIEGVLGEATNYVKGGIVALTTEGFIDDEVAVFGNAFTAPEGATYYVADDFNAETDTLGFSTVASYDATTGYLEINEDTTHIFQITEDTVVTFADKSAGGIKVVDADALASTGTLYKNNRADELQVLLCVEESEDFEDNDAYDVIFAMIVRE